MAEDKYLEYLKFHVPRKMSELRLDSGSKSDLLLLENHVFHSGKHPFGNNNCHMRIDGEIDPEKEQGFLERFGEDIEFIYMYHEISTKTEKPHYHAHIKYKHPIKIDNLRKQYKRYWKTEKLTLCVDGGTSRIYATKDLNRRVAHGIDLDLLRIYELISIPKRADLKEERKKKLKQLGLEEMSPMEKMLTAFKTNVELKVERYNTEHVDKREPSFYYTDRDIGIFVMEWYAKHLKKSFMINKMSECMMYIRYHVNNFGEDNVDEITLSRLMEKSFG